MKRRPAALVVLLLAVLAVMLVLPATGSAATLAQKKAQAKRIQDQLTVLNGRMEVAVEAYDAATQKLADVQARIAQNKKQLDLAQLNLTVARKTLADRAVAIYKQHSTDMLDVLLNTKSFDDLITEIDLMNRLSQGDSTVVSSVQTLKREIAQRRQQLVADRKKAVELVAQRAATKQQVAGSLAERQQTLASVKSDIKQIIAAQERAKALAAQRAAQAALAAPTYAPAAGGTTSSAGAHGGVVGVAQSAIGVPYVWGGASMSGFDCSGLAMYCYLHGAGISLPHNAAMQYAVSTPVAHGSEQPGDLVFFGNPIHHVGIYVGNGQMIDAPYTGVNVRYDSAFSGDYYASGRP